MLATLTLALAAPVLSSHPATPPSPPEETSAYVEAMAREHQQDEPEPSPLALLAPRQPVVGEHVEYGAGATGYVAKPVAAAGVLPGVIVIHEWWGLNDNIEAMTRRLAGEGYIALAVDLYGGKVAEDRQAAMTYMREAMSDEPAARANLRAAHDWLEAHSAGKIGVVGWCFGGGWSLQTALLLGPQINATVIYYGRLVVDPEALRALSSPVLGLFGSEDRGIPVSSVHAFEQALEQLGRPHEIKIYDGANHAFANPSGTAYDAEAASDAWQRTVAFFAQNLKD